MYACNRCDDALIVRAKEVPIYVGYKYGTVKDDSRAKKRTVLYGTT